MKIAPIVLALVFAAPALAAEPPPAVTTPLATRTTTLSGQPIVAPAGPLQASLAETRLAPGASLPAHRHPYQRYVFVLEGRVEVTNMDTGEITVLDTGDFVAEARGQWHSARVLGDSAARLLAIDETPVGQTNLERRAP